VAVDLFGKCLLGQVQGFASPTDCLTELHPASFAFAGFLHI